MMWLLKFAKDRILGVDTPRQQVPPRVRYGMACSLIRNILGSVSCSDEWVLTWYFTQAHMVQEGPLLGDNITASGAFVGNDSKV
jgi:hypothetical protein